MFGNVSLLKNSNFLKISNCVRYVSGRADSGIPVDLLEYSGSLYIPSNGVFLNSGNNESRLYYFNLSSKIITYLQSASTSPDFEKYKYISSYNRYHGEGLYSSIGYPTFTGNFITSLPNPYTPITKPHLINGYYFFYQDYGQSVIHSDNLLTQNNVTVGSLITSQAVIGNKLYCGISTATATLRIIDFTTPLTPSYTDKTASGISYIVDAIAYDNKIYCLSKYASSNNLCLAIYDVINDNWSYYDFGENYDYFGDNTNSKLSIIDNDYIFIRKHNAKGYGVVFKISTNSHARYNLCSGDNMYISKFIKGSNGKCYAVGGSNTYSSYIYVWEFDFTF